MIRRRQVGRVEGLRPRRALAWAAALLPFFAPFLSTAREKVDLATDPDAVRIVGEDLGDRMGSAVASCDFNGDGLLDLVIGAADADGVDNVWTSTGEVYVIYGHRGRWSGPLDAAEVRDVWIIGEDGFDSLGKGLACGDVNGDGFDDLLPGAYNANGPNNSRNQAGQIHVVFGSVTPPAVIDFQQDPGTVIYGAAPIHAVGRPVAGDITGDGLLDISADARGVDKIYVYFGRETWPESVDLLTDTDVLIHSAGGAFADSQTVGDLDGDGIDELIIGARLGDGPGDIRPNAGDNFVFLGRPQWPAEIFLTLEPADMRVFGADEQDQAGSLLGLRVGDIDGDGTSELMLGARLADGRDNALSLAGDVRLIEPGSPLPAIVDLRTDSQHVIYGAQEGDEYGDRVFAADFNGDGIDDLAASANAADGPLEDRSGAGEVTIVFGRPLFPAELDLDAGDEDVIVYGSVAGDRLRLMGVADVNGDGLWEIVAASSLDSSTRLPSVWIVSPFDIDGDGITQLADNCPLIANPDQVDTDGDLIGDACQGDYDGDGLDDATDCAPGDATGGTPADVAGLVFEAGSTTTLTWNAAAFADTYDISRGDIAALDGNDYGACQNHRDPDLTDLRFVDDDLPGSAAGFFYVIRGRNERCGVAGTYGEDSGAQERINANPASCP